jgi:hypothetical protein
MAYTEIDTDSLFARMFGAAREDARSNWNDIRGILKVELKATARQIKELGKGVALGDLPQEQARLLVRLTRSHIATVLASATSLTIVTADLAVGAALDAVREDVNKAVGFYLL